MTEASGNAVSGATLKVSGKQAAESTGSRYTFTLRLDETNYNKPTTVEIWRGGKKVSSLAVDFFTETPIRAVVP